MMGIRELKYTYKSVDNLNLPLQIFLPENINNNMQTVVCIHGGGWRDAIRNNDPWNGGWMKRNAEYFAERGMIGAVISYRSIELESVTNVGDIIDDCLDAIDFIMELDYINPNRVSILGDSAGAHLALCLSFLKDVNMAKIIACNPVTDCTYGVFTYIGQNNSERRLYSPVYSVKHSRSEYLIMHGTEDNVVNINDSRHFFNSMVVAGNKCSMTEIEGAKHAFILYGYTEKEENVNLYMKQIYDFLHL